MADDLAKAQAIGEMVQKPKCYWHQDSYPAMHQHADREPFFLVQVVSTLKNIAVALTGNFVGDPTDVHLAVYNIRDGSTVDTFGTNFQALWANAVTSIGTPGWDLRPGDVLALAISQTSPGAATPGMLVVITTEPS
jgi:hypothetical protein